jgi:hypothetical protein
VPAEAWPVHLLLVDQVLEHQVVLGVDAPHVDHLVAHRELVVLVHLLDAALHKLRVHRHEPLQLAWLPPTVCVLTLAPRCPLQYGALTYATIQTLSQLNSIGWPLFIPLYDRQFSQVAGVSIVVFAIVFQIALKWLPKGQAKKEHSIVPLPAAPDDSHPAPPTPLESSADKRSNDNCNDEVISCEERTHPDLKEP